MNSLKFLFDLDRTVCTKNAMTIFSAEFDICAEIRQLEDEIENGNIPFVEGFIKKMQLLGKLPVDKVNETLQSTEIYPELRAFIKANADRCVLLTENVSCWYKRFSAGIDCEFYASEGIEKNNRVEKIARILKKEAIVEKYRQEGYTVVFIGNSILDSEAMRTADISIAFGKNNYPSKRVLPMVNYLIFNEKTLCRQLNQLS